MAMIIHTKIQKWGNGLALRVSGGMRDIPHFVEGTEVDVEIFDEGFLVKKSLLKKNNLFPYSESQLLESLNQTTSHPRKKAMLSRSGWHQEITGRIAHHGHADDRTSNQAACLSNTQDIPHQGRPRQSMTRSQTPKQA